MSCVTSAISSMRFPAASKPKFSVIVGARAGETRCGGTEEIMYQRLGPLRENRGGSVAGWPVQRVANGVWLS